MKLNQDITNALQNSINDVSDTVDSAKNQIVIVAVAGAVIFVVLQMNNK